MSYFFTKEIVVDKFSDEIITGLYEDGFLLTRNSCVFHKTRSLRINLKNFKFNSENKRVLRKIEGLDMDLFKLPYVNYSWEIHQMGKSFYENRSYKSMDKVESELGLNFSANKIKELFTTNDQNVNFTLVYKKEGYSKPIGYSLIYQNLDILHYAYPFYSLDKINLPITNYVGMGMILLAIKFALDSSKKYFYLGSVVALESKYKLQFKNLEWFDLSNNSWNVNLNELKNLL